MMKVTILYTTICIIYEPPHQLRRRLFHPPEVLSLHLESVLDPFVSGPRVRTCSDDFEHNSSNTFIHKTYLRWDCRPLCCCWWPIQNDATKPENLAHGYSADLKALNKSYSMNTNMTGFKCFFKNLYVLVLWTKVASALQGLKEVFGGCLVFNRKFLQWHVRKLPVTGVSGFLCHLQMVRHGLVE